MNTVYHRELLRAEIKSTAYHRRTVKARARNLLRMAQEQVDNQKLSNSSDYERSSSLSYAAMKLKKSQASYARSLNIANGLIKGMPYKKVEFKCVTAPNFQEILNIILNHIMYQERKKWTIERVTSLITAE